MSSPSVIVYATQHMPTGGIESHLHEFCAHLAEAGVQVDLVILNSNMLPETEAFFRRVCRNVYLGNQGRSGKRLVWLVGVSIRLSANRYNALYTNGRGGSIELFANLVRRRIVWIHHHHMAGDVEDQLAWGSSYRKALCMANQVVACSQRNAQEMAQALSRNIKVIPCFSRQVTKAFALPTAKLRFGYYGRLIREKGIEVLCKLSEEAELAEVEFHLWGEGEEYPATFFDKYPQVRYHGTYSGAEGLSRVLGTIDAFLLLSTHSEGLPISLLEAMSAGIPWLATDRGGIVDIVCDPQATRLLPAAATYEQVKEATVSFATDIKLGRINQTRQIELYRERFSVSALLAQWLQMLAVA
jgi:glycosyltransferase involved in cell wall biosynthesis